MMTLCRAALALLILLVAPAARAQQNGNAPPPPLKELRPDTRGPCFSLAWGPDDRYLAAGGKGGIRLLSPARIAGKKKASLPVLLHRGHVDQVEFVSQANALIAKSEKGVLVWNAETLQPVRTAVQDLTVLGFAYHAGPKGKGKDWSCTVLSDRKSGMRLWLPERPREGRLFVREVYLRQQSGVSFGHVTAAGSDPDSLLLGNRKGDLFKLTDHASLLGRRDYGPPVVGGILEGGGRPDHMRVHAGAVTSIAMAPGSGLCVTAGADGWVRMWKVKNIPDAKTKPEWEIPGHLAELSRDGRFLAVARTEGVGVYHAASGVGLAWNPLNPKAGRIVRLRFNEDGTQLAGILCPCLDCLRGRSGDKTLHGGRLVIWK